MKQVKLGLIVNPIAGIGGRVGLKGSDGSDIRSKALALGAEPRAGERAGQALGKLDPIKDDLLVLTYPGEMGENIDASIGFEVRVIGSIDKGNTTAADTINAARDMLELDADLILFAGGDGTARDIYNAVGQKLPVLGIPAGVKDPLGCLRQESIQCGRYCSPLLVRQACINSRSRGYGH